MLIQPMTNIQVHEAIGFFRFLQVPVYRILVTSTNLYKNVRDLVEH